VLSVVALNNAGRVTDLSNRLLDRDPFSIGKARVQKGCVLARKFEPNPVVRRQGSVDLEGGCSVDLGLVEILDKEASRATGSVRFSALLPRRRLPRCTEGGLVREVAP